ncbi:MAG TPA: VOC family protein [Acidimicrobiales bacterium]|nr:VOC family protein [Acidimicrobiales bacterium]
MSGYRIGNIAIDCNDLEGMTSFWGAMTGLSPLAGDDSFCILGDAEHQGRLKLYLQRVPEPRVGKNRLHIDLYVSNAAAALAEVEQLGGASAGTHEREGINWTVATDPEGNEFCLVEVLRKN